MNKVKQEIENVSGVNVDEAAANAKDYAINAAKKAGCEAKKYADKGAKQVSHSVSKNPLRALGIAAAAGAVLGFILRRKK